MLRSTEQDISDAKNQLQEKKNCARDKSGERKLKAALNASGTVAIK
jgi:hypothetical protein